MKISKILRRSSGNYRDAIFFQIAQGTRRDTQEFREFILSSEILKEISKNLLRFSGNLL